MKSLLLLLFLFTLNLTAGPIDKLMGRWKLLKIDINSTTYLPKATTYILTVKENRIMYNLDVNECYATILSVDDSTISVRDDGCSHIGADGNDPIATYIDYNGNYTLHDSMLVITNHEETMYLKKL
jgi:hypothetical protein